MLDVRRIFNDLKSINSSKFDEKITHVVLEGGDKLDTKYLIGNWVLIFSDYYGQIWERNQIKNTINNEASTTSRAGGGRR